MNYFPIAAWPIVLYTLHSTNSTVHRNVIDDKDNVNLILLFFMKKRETVKIAEQTDLMAWSLLFHAISIHHPEIPWFSFLCCRTTAYISICAGEMWLFLVRCSTFCTPSMFAVSHLSYCMLTLINVCWWLFSEITRAFFQIYTEIRANDEWWTHLDSMVLILWWLDCAPEPNLLLLLPMLEPKICKHYYFCGKRFSFFYLFFKQNRNRKPGPRN